MLEKNQISLLKKIKRKSIFENDLTSSEQHICNHFISENLVERFTVNNNFAKDCDGFPLQLIPYCLKLTEKGASLITTENSDKNRFKIVLIIDTIFSLSAFIISILALLKP